MSNSTLEKSGNRSKIPSGVLAENCYVMVPQADRKEELDIKTFGSETFFFVKLDPFSKESFPEALREINVSICTRAKLVEEIAWDDRLPRGGERLVVSDLVYKGMGKRGRHLWRARMARFFRPRDIDLMHPEWAQDPTGKNFPKRPAQSDEVEVHNM